MAEQYQIAISQRADDDLEQTLNYVLRRSRSVSVAEKVRQGIVDTIYSLEVLPYRNPKFIPGNDLYRYMPKWSYLIIYKVIEEAKTVLVVEIGHSSQDRQAIVDRLLEDD